MVNGIQRMIGVALLLVAGVGPVSAGNAAATDGSLRSVLEERYAAMKSAMDSDPKTVAALLAPDFLSEDLSGKTESASDMIQQLGTMPKDPNRVSDTTVLSVQVSGDTATVQQRYHMTTTKAGADGTTRQAVELETLSTDTWINSAGTWLLRRTVTNQLDYKIDGRLVAHKDRAGGAPAPVPPRP
jgi:ketosteroid isomerase-like protein